MTFEPLEGFERSAGEPRRYLIQKKRIGRKITAIKKSEINVSAKKSVSTSCAPVEACGGKRWNLSIPHPVRDTRLFEARAIRNTHSAINPTKPTLAMRNTDNISAPYLPVMGL